MKQKKKSSQPVKAKPLTAKFIKSAVFGADYPAALKPEIAVAGRSNAGKSSFINALVGSKIAKVSQTPGKTRLLNFFTMGENYYLVDMPGYGFASRSGGEVEEWGQMIEHYLASRETLRGVLLVMDIRREWDQEEKMLKEFCDRHGLAMLVVLTKSDKISRGQAQSLVLKMKKVTHLDLVFAVSNLERKTVLDVEQIMFDQWIKKQ